MSNNVLCGKCKHSVEDKVNQFVLACSHPDVLYDHMNGDALWANIKIFPASCKSERSAGKVCGREGKKYEPISK